MQVRLAVVVAIVASLPGFVSGQALSVSPASLSFTGNSNGVLPPAQIVTIINTGTAPAPISIDHSVSASPWLSPAGLNTNTLAGGASTTIQVYASTQGIAPGTYDAAFTVTGGSNGPQMVAIHFVVGTPGKSSITISTNAVSLTAAPYASLFSTSQPLTVTNTGTAGVNVLMSGSQPWIANSSFVSLLPQASANISVTAYTAFLGPGTYDAFLSLDGADNGTQTIAVHLTVSPAAAGVPTFGAVVNAASYSNTGVALGEVVSIFGTNLGTAAAAIPDANATSAPTVLGGTRVLFAGIPAPLLYAQNGQINAIVPQFPLDLSGSVTAQVEYLGILSAPLPVHYSDFNFFPDLNVFTAQSGVYSPGVFTFDESGKGPAVALNQDGTLNNANNPAATGSTVSIFATGLGPTNPATLDGQFVTTATPAAVAPNIVISGNAVAGIASLIPGLVNGVYPVTFVIPPQTASGAASIAIRLTLPSGASRGRFSTSQDGVTLAVR